MKNKVVRNKLEKGQILPLVVLMMFVIIGMVALIVDGGAIMSNRRTAQAAADAGAMAGAQRLCTGKLDAIAVAQTFAASNEATTAIATIAGKQITVNTTVENPSFFAKIFGQDTLIASANATAGCYGVNGVAPLPLAWNCRALPVGGGPYDPQMGCQMQTISWDLLGPMADPDWAPASQRKTSINISDFDGNIKSYHMSGTSVVDNNGIPPEQLYIIIDDDKICTEDGNMNGSIPCDIDGDGKIDIVTGGNRGWLYLTSDTNSIKKWLGDPPPPLTLFPHTWLSADSGNMATLYKDMIDYGYEGQVVMIPVYNYICDGDPRTNAACVAAAHASPWPAEPSSGDVFDQIRNKKLNYHIVTYAPFYISCVQRAGNGHSSPECPGIKYAEDRINSNLFRSNVSLEGFFLTDVDVSLDPTNGCDMNLGNCTISLSH